MLPVRSVVMESLKQWRLALGLVVAMGLTLVVALMAPSRRGTETEGAPVSHAPYSLVTPRLPWEQEDSEPPAWRWHEVAKPWEVTEAASSAAPPGASTPAPTAANTMPSTDKDSKPKNEGKRFSETRGVLDCDRVRQWVKSGIAVSAAALAACTTPGAATHPGTTPKLLPEPETVRCPEEVFRAMKEMKLTGTRPDYFGVLPYVGERAPVPIRLGPTTVALRIPWGALPEGTLLYGRVFVAGSPGRHANAVYAWFTEARTPDNKTFKVCIGAEAGGSPNWRMLEGSTPERPKVDPWLRLDVKREFRGG
jgi:hypothetical protein